MTTFTPQEEKVYAALSKILTNEFDIPAEKIRPEARLYEDFDIDSIDAVDMIVQLKPYLGNRTVKPEALKRYSPALMSTATVSNREFAI